MVRRNWSDTHTNKKNQPNKLLLFVFISLKAIQSNNNNIMMQTSQKERKWEEEEVCVCRQTTNEIMKVNITHRQTHMQAKKIKSQCHRIRHTLSELNATLTNFIVEILLSFLWVCVGVCLFISFYLMPYECFVCPLVATAIFAI